MDIFLWNSGFLFSFVLTPNHPIPQLFPTKRARGWQILYFCNDKLIRLQNTYIMTILNKLIILAVAAFSTLTALADIYQAKTVTVKTSDMGSQAMTLLGTTAEGNQIWACSNSYVGDGDQAEWIIDGTTSVSKDVSAFYFYSTTKYELATNYSTENDRRLANKKNLYQFLRINSETSATLFYADSTSTTKTSYDNFCLAPKITLSMEDKGFVNDDNQLLQHVKVSVTGIEAAAITSVDLVYSYDGGKTWEKGMNSDNFSTTDKLFAFHPETAEKVRYKLIIYTKDKYRTVADAQYESEATEDFDISHRGHVYKLVTSANELKAGDTYVIANTATEKALGAQVSDTHNRKAEEVLVSGKKLKVLQDVAASEFTLGSEAGSWTFLDKSADGTSYLGATGESNDAYYLENTLDKDKYTANISVSSSGDATITFGNTATTNNTIAYNNSAQAFACYPKGTSSETVKSVQLYHKVSTFTISSVGYSTFYTDDTFYMPDGVTGYTVTLKDDNTIQLNEAYTAGAFVPDSTGLLLKGAPGTYDFIVPRKTGKTPADDLLYGSVVDETTNVSGATKYYKLSLGTDGKAGFYYGAQDGGKFTNKAYKAYLALPSSVASQVRGFAFDDLDGTTTAIASLIAPNDTNVPASIHDLNGRRISTLRGAQKGVYIVNGQKVMVK